MKRVFISHASEDKEAFVRVLADALRSRMEVWYDEFELKIGDSLRETIELGLRDSDFGLVVLSKTFFRKEWTKKELNGLLSLEVGGRSRILPIWHNLSSQEVLEFSPVMADRVALSSNLPINEIVDHIAVQIGADEGIPTPNDIDSSISPGILVDHQIMEAIARGLMKIDPFDEDALSSASYDLSLGDARQSYGFSESVRFSERGHLELRPGESVVVSSKEVITLGSRIVGRLGAISFLISQGIVTNFGLQLDPGYSGRIIAHLTNLSQQPVELYDGEHFVSIEFSGLNRLPKPRRFGSL